MRDFHRKNVNIRKNVNMKLEDDPQIKSLMLYRLSYPAHGQQRWKNMYLTVKVSSRKNVNIKQEKY